MSGQLVHPESVRECDHQPARPAGQSAEPACAGLQAQPSDRHPRRGLQPHLPDHTLPEVQQDPGGGGRAGQPHQPDKPQVHRLFKQLNNIKTTIYDSIRENQITGLPNTIGKLKHLAICDCSYNQLEHLPSGCTKDDFIWLVL